MSDSLPALLLAHRARHPKAVAMRKKSLGRWREYTWDEYVSRTAAVAAGLAGLGVKAGESVGVVSDSRPAWLLADLAVRGIGAVTIAVDPDAEPDQVAVALDGAVVVFAEDEEQLDKLFAVRTKLGALRTIVVIDPRGVRVLGDPMVTTLAALEAAGTAAGDALAAYERSVAALDPTPELPGGLDASDRDEVLSYLPLFVPDERRVAELEALRAGYVVNFGEGGDLFTQELREVQPTMFFGPPAVWERMKSGVETRAGNASRVKRAAYGYWMARGRAVGGKRREGRLGPVDRIVAGIGWVFLYRSLRDKLGLSRVHTAVVWGGAVAPDVADFFWAIGVPVREATFRAPPKAVVR